MEKRIGAIEVVLFKTKPGYTQDQAQEALESLNRHVVKFDGFISRKLSVDEQGNWMDLVYWESKGLALKAAEEIMKVPEAAQVFEVIDDSTIQMYHFNPAMTLNTEIQTKN